MIDFSSRLSQSDVAGEDTRVRRTGARASWFLLIGAFAITGGVYAWWLFAPSGLPRPVGLGLDYFDPEMKPSLACRTRQDTRAPLPHWRRVSEWRGDSQSVKTTVFQIRRREWHVFVQQQESLAGALGSLNVLIYLPNGEFGCALPSLYGNDSAWYIVNGGGRFYLDLGPGLIANWVVEVYEDGRGL